MPITPSRPRAITSAALTLLLLWIGTPVARADLLFSFTFGQGGSQPGATNGLHYTLAYANQDTSGIFSLLSWTTADTGLTRYAIHGSDPYFDAFTAQLTDGLPEDIIVWFLPYPAANVSGQGWPEATIVWNDPADPRVDAHPLTIQRYSLTQNSLTTSYDPTTGRSEYAANITFSAYSDLPEPATLSFAACGLALLPRRRHPNRITTPSR